ncbi:MAG: helix-turn-helix transcriptional regulator [Myxococcota bacterium]
MTVDPSHVLEVVEKAYDLDADEPSWLASTLGGLLPMLDHGMGAAAFYLDAFAPVRPRAWGHTVAGAVPVPLTEVRDRQVTLPADLERRAYMNGPLLLSREHLTREDWAQYEPLLDQFPGARDSVAVVALDAEGRGASFTALLPDVADFSRGARRQLVLLSAHLATAARLRRSLGAEEARFEPGGRLVHAAGRAEGRSAQEALREAVRFLDHSRSRRGRSDPEAALEGWQALVAGRWSLVDTFDHDGRRYWVAHENEPDAPDPRGLTRRERQVLTLRALGHGQKQIGYELGIKRSTAATHLQAARRKLDGLGDDMLAERFLELLETPPDEPEPAR